MQTSSRLSSVLLLVLAWAILAYLILPNLVAIPVSLTPTSYFSVPSLGGYSLRHYYTLVEDDRWPTALWTSVKVGVLSTALSLLLGTAAAIGLSHATSSWAQAMRLLVLLPMIVPTVVSGLAFYKTWVLFDGLDSLLGLVIAHAILTVPFVFIMVSASVSTLDPQLARASRSLGAGPWRTILQVVLPNIRGGVVAGAIVAFLVSWDEVIVTIFLTSFRMETLPKRILSVVRDDLDPSVAAASVVLMVATLTVSLLFQLRRRA